MPIFSKPIGVHIQSLDEGHLFKCYVRRGYVHLTTMMFAMMKNWIAQNI